MKLITKTNELNKLINSEHEGKLVGLVPTMGNLHQGHLSLIESALDSTERTIVTIFVNPKQFGPNEDFDKYPRTLEEDLKKIKELKGSENVIVYAPASSDEIYPNGFSTEIEVKGLDHALCGKHRPGHFKGVTTVVYQLFKLTRADIAFFGQKDFQQFKIIEKMVHDLGLPIKLEMCPIYREASGLAMSSRNGYLSENQREEAKVINQTLNHLKKIFLEDRTNINKQIEEILFKEPSWQYLEILDADTFQLIRPETKKVILAGAFSMGDTRLIDNIIFEV